MQPVHKEGLGNPYLRNALFEKLESILNEIKSGGTSPAPVNPQVIEKLNTIVTELENVKDEVLAISTKKQKKMTCATLTSTTTLSNTINGSVYNSGTKDINIGNSSSTMVLGPGMSFSWDSGNGNDTVDDITITIASGGEVSVSYLTYVEVDD